MKKKLSILMGVLLVASSLSAMLSLEAEARSFERKVTRTGPGGKSATTKHSHSTQRSGNSWSRQSTHTGPNGQTVTKSVAGQKTESGYSRTATTTGPNGQTVTKDTDFNYDPETKSWSKNSTATGPNGQTVTKSVAGQKTESGYSRTSTYTGPNGGSKTRKANTEYDPETNTINKDISWE